MNEPNLPEKQLSSWRPRRPSAALRRKILSAAQNSARHSSAWFWGWLAPAAACALLALANFNPAAIGGAKMERLLVSSNQFYPADSAQSSQNHLAAVTFDWTNHSVFPSSIRFTPTTNLSN